ncbi:AIR synthase-related protein [Pseudomonas aeruginosa]
MIDARAAAPPLRWPPAPAPPTSTSPPVQRDNPEMERRCREVIDRCWQLGERNPISFIHDVGAGGLSNALPELINDGGRGGRSSTARCPTTSRA